MIKINSLENECNEEVTGFSVVLIPRLTLPLGGQVCSYSEAVLYL